MAVAAKYQRHRRKCARCGVMFGCWRPTQRWCSQKCCANDRVAHQRAAGKVAGKLSAKRQTARVLAALRVAWPDAPAAALRLLMEQRRLWWLAGYRVGTKAGIRKGYADALGEDMEGTWSKARRAA